MKKTVLIKIFLTACVIFTLPPGPLRPEGFSVSGTAPAFLTVLVQPRPAGLAGAYTALADDLDSLFFNPAGLASLRSASFSVSYRTAVQDMGYGSIAAGYPVWKQGVLGAALSLQHQGEMEIFREDGNIENKGLSSSFFFALSCGFSFLNETLSIGSTAKFIQENLADYSASTMAFDLGLKYDPRLLKRSASRLLLGLALQNAGSGLSHLNQSEPLPLVLCAGLAFYRPFLIRALPVKLTAAFDAEWEKGVDAPVLKSGLEFFFRNAFCIRCGYMLPLVSRRGERTGFTTGLGIHAGSFRFDYALMLTESIISSAIHGLGVGYRF